MNKKNLSLLLVSAMFATGCGGNVASSATSESSKHKDGDECLINDFETESDLAMMRFPYPVHEARGKFELSDQHVTHGSKSVKFTNIYNSSFEMQHFFAHCASGSIDPSNVKSIEIDIYNDSPYDTSAAFTIYNNVELDILLQATFDLPKQEMTHVVFPLSKIALDFNAKTVVSSSLTLYTPNTDYDKFVGYTFYLDNWKATMGGEYTEEDKKYQPKINSITEKISALPKQDSISLKDEAALEEIAKDYCSLPDLYRRIVPNYSEYKAKLSAFTDLKLASMPLSPVRNVYMAMNEFYGSTQLIPTASTAAEVFFDDSVKLNAGDKGSTKVIFSGTMHSQFNFHSPISTNGYDNVHFTVKNETGHYTRVWINYASLIYFDMEEGETADFVMSASLFGAQDFWVIDQVKAKGDGTVVAGTGSIYIGEIYCTGRSEEERKAELSEAFNHLPDPEALVNKDDIIPHLSTIEMARKRYDESPDDIKQTISNTLYSRLLALENKRDVGGYGIAFNASKYPYNRYYYGENFETLTGVLDDAYGYVQKVILNDPRSDAGVPEQAIGFTDEIRGSYLGYQMAIYNPTESPVNCVVRNTNWDWDKYESYFTYATLLPGQWNVINIKPELLRISTDGKAAIFLSNPEMISLRGEWKISSLFGLPHFC
ncbi:MAG: hypothetical protein MJ239_04490 [Bacilli bacterium]|nr:hypothetical protein [Bacilli bacterium]